MPDTHDIGRLFTHAAQLSPDAPAAHLAHTAEYDDPGRYSRSLVIRTPFRRSARWFGVRANWLSIQVKLPFGEKIDAVWGIVVGWWRYPDDDGWKGLLRAVHLGHEPDGIDDLNYESPSRESAYSALIDISGRRVDAAGRPGADG